MIGPNKIQCTVGILTFNSGGTIKEALESARNFAEVIVCDGGSTDETLPLSRAYGAKVIVQAPEFKGDDNKIINFAGVRNQMLAVSSYRWFFYLDSDELLTPKLETEISAIISKHHPAAAFWVPRKYTLNGVIVDCSATYPSKQMRFFHQDAVDGFIKTIHERISVKSGMQTDRLENFMLVPFNPDPAFHRAKWCHYIDLEVARQGKISLWRWLAVCAENAKISVLYFYRYVRNLFFCRGKRMPWRLEWERHVYHFNICRRLFPWGRKS